MWISEREGNIIKAVKLTKIFDPDEGKERALKALKLNGFVTPDYDPAFDQMLRLKAASSPSIKPTLRIKRLSFSRSSNAKGIKLRGASLLQKRLNDDKVKSEKALRLNYGF